MKVYLTSLIALFIIALPKTSMAKMAADASFAAPLPKIAVPLTDMIQYYTKKQKQQKLTADEETLLSLSNISREGFEMTTVMMPEVPSQKNIKIESITAPQLIVAIRDHVKTKSNWNEKISIDKIELLKKESDFLKKNLGSSDPAWAWVQYQLGLKEDAKDILSKNFEVTFETVMKLKRIYNHENSPVENSERWHNLLKPMSNETENREREDKLKKMRTHISTLPDMMIMT